MNFVGETPPSISDPDGHTSVNEDTSSQINVKEPEQPLLAHMTKKSPCYQAMSRDYCPLLPTKTTSQPISRKSTSMESYTSKSTWHQQYMQFHHVMLLETRVPLLIVEPMVVLQVKMFE